MPAPLGSGGGRCYLCSPSLSFFPFKYAHKWVHWGFPCLGATFTCRLTQPFSCAARRGSPFWRAYCPLVAARFAFHSLALIFASHFAGHFTGHFYCIFSAHFCRFFFAHFAAHFCDTPVGGATTPPSALRAVRGRAVQLSFSRKVRRAKKKWRFPHRVIAQNGEHSHLAILLTNRGTSSKWSQHGDPQGHYCTVTSFPLLFELGWLGLTSFGLFLFFYFFLFLLFSKPRLCEGVGESAARRSGHTKEATLVAGNNWAVGGA